MPGRELPEALRRAIADAIASAGERGTVLIWIERGRVSGWDITMKVKYQAGEAAA